MRGREAEARDSETSRRIIAAASEEFAQRGYSSARVRAIVETAQANLAAVNYYFGGKEGLYRATVRHLTSRARLAPAERRCQAPEERLYRQVFAILAPHLGVKRPSRLGRILAHEAINPTAHLDLVLDAMARPEIENLRAIARELAGPEAADVDITCAALSVMGQCLFHVHGRSAIDLLFPESLRGAEACKSLARRITDFSLAGIARLCPPRSRAK